MLQRHEVNLSPWSRNLNAILRLRIAITKSCSPYDLLEEVNYRQPGGQSYGLPRTNSFDGDDLIMPCFQANFNTSTTPLKPLKVKASC